MTVNQPHHSRGLLIIVMVNMSLSSCLAIVTWTDQSNLQVFWDRGYRVLIVTGTDSYYQQTFFDFDGDILRCLSPMTMSI